MFSPEGDRLSFCHRCLYKLLLCTAKGHQLSSPCYSLTLRQDSPVCPALMESTRLPSVRQPVSCDVVWVENWVGVMSQESGDRREAMWRNLASISVYNRSPGDLHRPKPWNLMRYKTFQNNKLRVSLSSYLPVNKIVRVQPEIDRIQWCKCPSSQQNRDHGRLWDVLTIIADMKRLSLWILKPFSINWGIYIMYCLTVNAYHRQQVRRYDNYIFSSSSSF